MNLEKMAHFFPNRESQQEVSVLLQFVFVKYPWMMFVNLLLEKISFNFLYLLRGRIKCSNKSKVSKSKIGF